MVTVIPKGEADARTPEESDRFLARMAFLYVCAVARNTPS